MMRKNLCLCWMIFTSCVVAIHAQSFSISGQVIDSLGGGGITGANIVIDSTNLGTITDSDGRFRIEALAKGRYYMTVSFLGMETRKQIFEIIDRDVNLTIQLANTSIDLEGVVVAEEEEGSFGISRLKAVEGVAIYAAKKNEVVLLKDVTANLAANNSRQVYARVAGLNIWESDGAGVQLGIGGRGLSPNRNSNFNTRQNGYDISADALGYPESYYTPPVEGIDRIEIVRGAASLQYGTQFGGMLNFKFKEGPIDDKIQLTSRNTVGSFDFFSSFNSLGGTVGKLNYYGFYQYKKSNGWRPNSSLDQHTAYLSARYQLSTKLSAKAEYTYMTYLAQQPGGLTDAQFASDPRQSNRERNWFHVDWNLWAVELEYRLSDQTRLNSRTFGLVGGRDALGNLERINLLDFGENRDFLSDDFNNWGNETRLIHKYTVFKQPAVFLVGLRYYDGLTKRRQGEGNDGSGPDFEYLSPDVLEGSDFELPSNNFALFAEHIFNLSPHFSLTPGVRFENLLTQANGYYRITTRDLAGNVLTDEVFDEDKSNQRSFVFFGLGASLKPIESVEIYGNFSQNYRAINFNDIRVNVGALVVDPELKDERGFNVDLGFRGNFSGFFNFDLSLFLLSYRDRIGTVLRTEPNPLFNNLVDRTFRFRTNVADARIHGAEVFAEINLVKLFNEQSTTRFTIFTNFAFIDAKYTDSRENGIEGNEVELVPAINVKTGLSLSWKDLKAAWQFGYVGEHFSDASNAIRTASAIEGIIPAYQVMDLSVSYQYRAIHLAAGINNLANEFYFTRRATGYPGPGIIPSDGRSFYLTVGFVL